MSLKKGKKNPKGKGKNSDSAYEVAKGPWKKDEDRLLLKLVEEFGAKDWSSIAARMANVGVVRKGKQCRERWYNHLSPEVRKDAWTEKEDEIIIKAHLELGNKWTRISRMLDGRPANAIKNHWNATLKRRFDAAKSSDSESIGSGGRRKRKRESSDEKDIVLVEEHLSSKIPRVEVIPDEGESLSSLWNSSSPRVDDTSSEDLSPRPQPPVISPRGTTQQSTGPSFLSIPVHETFVNHKSSLPIPYCIDTEMEDDCYSDLSLHSPPVFVEGLVNSKYDPLEGDMEYGWCDISLCDASLLDDPSWHSSINSHWYEPLGSRTEKLY